MKTLRTILITMAFVALAFLGANPVNALEYKETLSSGDTGENVIELQQCLLAMGYELPKYGADGSFGNETFVAVVLHQQENDLTVDGVVGPKTAESIDCESPRERGMADVDEVEFDLQENELLIHLSGILGNGCTKVVPQPKITLDTETSEFAVTLNTLLPREDEVCAQVEVEYEVSTQIDISELEAGEYTVVINEDDDFDYEFEIIEEGTDELAVEEPTSDDVEDGVNNTSAMAVSSAYDTQKRDTAVFNFKMNLSPFEDPIYVPAVADASVDINVFNDSDEPVDEASVTVRSQAPKVTGADGNVYYKVEEPTVFIYTATATPGMGSYYARLVNVSFTSQDVTKRDYAGFSGLKLSVDAETWTTQLVELDA